jgi:hypothetical protein
MTEAQARQDGVMGGGGEATHIGSILSVASTWVVAVVFVKWCLAGPPFHMDDAPVLLAAMRAAFGLLVVSIVRLRPAAVAVAWVVALVIATFGGLHWLSTGHAYPYASWEILVPAAYAIFLPIAIWLTPERRRPHKVLAAARPAPAQVHVETRRTTGSVPAIAEPYGTGLANKVADLLERGQAIVYGHPDYCGTGLRHINGRYVYDEVYEGELACLRQRPLGFDRALAVFNDRPSFVAWLAQQCDQSLSGRDRADPFFWNNQRITRTRLERAVEVARVTGDFAVIPSPTIRPQPQR